MVELSDNTTDTATEIVHATYRVLAQEGYADLTTQKIADECNKSQGVVHYHFDTKEELLRAVIDHLIEARIDQLNALPEDDTIDRLHAFFDCILPSPDNVSQTAVVNLAVHAQAPYNSPYQTHLKERDQLLCETLVGIIEDGINQNIFDPVDTEQIVETVLLIADGARFRAVTLDKEEAVSSARDALDQFVQSELLANNTNESMTY